MKIIKIFGLILFATFLIISAYFFSLQFFWPSNNRDWSPDQAVLSYADINSTNISIHNIRNFEYRTKDDYDIKYYDKNFNLDDIQSLWYIVVPFSNWAGPAHAFLSFGFKDGSYVSISVEIRKEKNEVFSPLKGLFNQYEIMYVVADENDVIKLRTNYRESERVYLYPVKTTPDRIKQIFIDMLQSANKLKSYPEFYNTITNNCTSNIVRHVNDVVPGRIPKIAYQIVLPGYSDKLAYKLGLIDTNLSWQEVRPYFYINDRAKSVDPQATSQEFSKEIRQFK